MARQEAQRAGTARNCAAGAARIDERMDALAASCTYRGLDGRGISCAMDGACRARQAGRLRPTTRCVIGRR